MPINLAGGYAAGGVHDALLEIVKQRMLERELAQREEENQFQRLRANRLDTRQAEQDAYTRQRNEQLDKIAEETRTQQNQIGRYNVLKGQSQADINASLGEDPTTAHAVPTPTPSNIPGGGPSYRLPAVPMQSNRMDIGGVKIRPPSAETLDEQAAIDEQRKLQNEITKAKALEALKPKTLQHVAGTFQGKPAMGAFDPETASTTPIPGWTPTPPQPQTVVVSTVDENGIPVNQIVPKVAGATYKRGPNATTGNRLDSAMVVAQTGNDLITHLSDPAFQAVVGPAMGRASSLRDFIGNPPPEFAELAGQIESYALANMGVHGMRSAEGAKQIAALLDQRHTPASLIATVKGLNAFSEHYLANAGRTVPTSEPKTGASTSGFPAAGTERTVGGKVYVSDGTKFVPKGGG